jgi:hypothetical protein
MKTFTLLMAAAFALSSAKAQYSQNFEGGTSALTGACWSMIDVHHTSTPGDVINGTGSMYTNPPTSGGSTRDIVSPALNVTSTSFTVSFNYKLSSKINGNATRTIEVGVLTPSGSYIILAFISMDKNTPIAVQNFNMTFTLPSAGLYKLVLKIGGATGDGNSRVIFDDIYASAPALYAGGCNTAPVAVDDIFNGVNGMPFTGNVILNDNDPNGELIHPNLVVTSVDGTVVMNADGSFTFTPNPGFIGLITTFTYNLTDEGFDAATSNTATVTINFSNPIVLPVKLLSFTAQLNSNNKVDLKWSTATEINASHFVIEKSLDGQVYSDAGTVFAAGNSTSVQHYTFTDNLIPNTKSVIYYRLRQVDVDGKAGYSATRIIRTGKDDVTATILTFPNPVASDLRITIPNDWQGKKVNYEVVNVSGQTAMRMAVGSSSQTETLSLASLAPGFYLVKVTCNGNVAQQKIVKQ